MSSKYSAPMIVYLTFLFTIFGVVTASSDIENVIISFVYNNSNSNESLMKLRSARLEDLPLQLRDVVQNSKYGEHMCCRNRPVTLITKTRQVKRVSIEKTEVKKESHNCGFLGTGSCETYGFVYRQVITYVREYFKDINYRQCPDRHVVCCNYYIMVSEKCVHLDDLHAVTQEIVG